MESKEAEEDEEEEKGKKSWTNCTIMSENAVYAEFFSFFFLGCPITELITWDTEKVINGTNEKSGIEYVSL